MNRKILSVLCIFTLMLAITMPSQAATGYQGYAVYRDGVGEDFINGFNYEWHGAIMVTPNNASSHPVSQSVNGIGTQLGMWQDFLDGYTFKGYFIADSSLFNSKRDSVVSTARELASAEIEYVFWNQMHYDVNYNPYNHGYVWISDIISMRCDGVVEYCYEYNNMRVFGSNTYWNISKWGTGYYNQHDYWSVTPKSQAQNYLVEVTG